MKIKIKFTVEKESDDDCWLYRVTASRDGLTGRGHGYRAEDALVKAENDLIKQEKNLSPTSANWENTVEAQLCQ